MGVLSIQGINRWVNSSGATEKVFGKLEDDTESAIDYDYTSVWNRVVYLPRRDQGLEKQA